jgi:zinc protease
MLARTFGRAGATTFAMSTAILLATAAAAGAADKVELPVPGDPTVSFSVWFKIGSQNDPPGKEGLASLTANLLTDGATTENSYQQILEKLYPLASRYGVRVDKEMTVLSGRTHIDNVETYFKLYTDAYLKPAFSAADFERVRSNQLNYLETTLRFASEEDLGKETLVHFAFEGTPYDHPVAGTVQGLKSITLDDVKAFYRQHFTRANAVVGIGGGYSADLLGRFEKTLAALPAGTPTAAPKIDVPPLSGRQVLLIDKEGADASISFGFPVGVKRGDRDFYALALATSWLGEHRSSAGTLFQVIREQRGMNYGDYAYIEAYPEGGQRQQPPPNVARRHQLFEVWIRTLPNDNALFAIRAAMLEIEKKIKHGLSEEEFQLTRSFLTKYCLHFAETTHDRLGWRIDDAFYGIGGDGHLAKFAAMMQSLSRDEVNAAIRKHWQLDNLRIAIVTGAAERLREQMVSDAATPPTYATPKAEAVLEEDKSIQVYPLKIKADAVRVVPVKSIFER